MRGEEREPYDEMESEFEADRKLVLAELRSWVESFSEEELDRHFLMLGRNTFTPREIIKEVEEMTEWGRYFVRMWKKHRLELARRNLL